MDFLMRSLIDLNISLYRMIIIIAYLFLELFFCIWVSRNEYSAVHYEIYSVALARGLLLPK